ncbi:MAG TPA: AAA family ATPase [Solirubrobacteraceae bacterium]|nr:AAA family ATPase [Solirubrobacteraceae bacterium]
MSAAPTLRVRLLGGLELRLGDARLAPLDSARAESLLAYLLLHRETAQARQRLAFMLWPDSSEGQARTNLRHVLHNLRRALPDADRLIDVTPRTLQWRADAPLALDVADFEQALADGRPEAAVAIYSGDLLEGSYDDWVLEERERLRALYLDALELLALQLHERGELPAAVRHAERLVRQDPLREDAHRLLMRLYDACGDRARALRAYHVCASTLQRELAIAPSPATRAAYAALLAAPADLAEGGGGTPGEAGPALIGRAAEHARLMALWRASGRGRAQLALVTGEPGIGKSRLVEELRAWCAQAGAVTAEARSYRAEGAVAYGPVIAWLRADPIAAQLRRLDRAHVTELARLLPELLSDVPDLPAPEPLPASELRRRLFDALARALLGAAAPVLLVADDLQWCDRQTLQVLHYLVRTNPRAPLLVAATARREDVDVGHPVHDLLNGLRALGRMTEIELGRLDRDETRLLAERIAGGSLTDADAERLHDVSEGNPLFVVEALRADAAGVAGATPSKVHAVIAARLAQLSDDARELVGVAATIGREFTSRALAHATTLDGGAFVRALDELWRRGLVRAHGPSAYDFSHGSIRDVALAELSPVRRTQHHLRVARALERLHAADLDAVSALLAAQYEGAGAVADAVAWYLRAARSAQRVHANADAVRLLERALEAHRSVPAGAGRDARELEILTTLPAPLVAVEGYLSERVREVHDRALRLAGTLGAEPPAPLVRSLALAALTRGDFGEARGFGEQLRARGEREHDDVLWVEGAYVLGVAAFWQGRLHEARSRLEDAIGRYRPEHRGAHLLRYGQDPRVFCLMRLAYTLWLLGRDDESARTRDAALAHAAASGHPYTRAAARVWAAMLALEGRDERRLRELVRQAAATGAGDEPRQIAVLQEILAAHVDVLDGAAREGIARIERALDEVSSGEPPAPGAPGLVARVLLEACAAAGDARAGLRAADRALVLGGGAQLWEAEIRRLRAEFACSLGAPLREIDAELVLAVEVAERQGASALAARAQQTRERLDAGRDRERPRNDHAATMATWRPTT